MARGPHRRHGRQVRARVVVGRAGKAVATSGRYSRAALVVTTLMTRHNWVAAHVVTVLLLATVGVAWAVAKPTPPLPTTNSTYDPHEEEYYYYDYDYEEEDANQLNMSEFRLPEGAGSGAPHVPRYMLELYADHRAHPLPGADLVRSFIAATTGKSLLHPRTTCSCSRHFLPRPILSYESRPS